LGGEAADVGVALDRLRAATGGVAAARVQARGEVMDRGFEGVGDRGEVLLVGGDQRRGGLVGEVVGEGENGVARGGRCGRHRAIVRPYPGLAARPPTSYKVKEGSGISRRGSNVGHVPTWGLSPGFPPCLPGRGSGWGRSDRIEPS